MNDWYVTIITEGGEATLFGPFSGGQAMAIEEDVVGSDPTGNTLVYLHQPKEYLR